MGGPGREGGKKTTFEQCPPLNENFQSAEDESNI